MFINGEWIETGKLLDIKNPANGEVVYQVHIGNRDHVHTAIIAAKQAFKAWSSLTALERANYMLEICRLLNENKRALAEVITKEMGKPIRDALSEVQSGIDYFRWFAEEGRRVYGEIVPANAADKRIIVMKQPIGVVGVITPWNFPLGMLARKVAPALASGCTMVIKPASQSPQTAIELCKICEKAGIPRGVINLTIVPAKDVSDEFIANPDVRKITFTGSTQVGKYLIAESAKTVKRVSMELGGHAPFIVMKDADLDLAVEGILQSKFRCSGQMCTATNRVYVQNSIAERFTRKLMDKVKTLKVGHGLDEDTIVGPLVDWNAVDKVDEQVQDALHKGAELVYGGTRLTEGEYAAGSFYAPTVLANVSSEMNIYNEETFGPILPIVTFETETELLAQVNHPEYGLASYLYSNDISQIIRITEKLEYGMVGVNDSLPFVVQAPFGGIKESGVGREGGHQGIEDYLETKLISIKFKLSEEAAQ